jgi:hypothetical protein
MTFNTAFRLRLLILLAIVSTAYFVLFTTWAFYDDEGYVLWTLIHHRQGHVLYEEVFSQYGPAFYALDASLRVLIPFAYTTDGQRWLTFAFWIASTALLLRTLACLVPRPEPQNDDRSYTSTGLFLFAAIALFWHQEKLALEPGHPQIWCSLLVCTSIYLIAARYQSRVSIASSTVPLLQGILAGTLFMIKPNVGIFLLAALPSGYLWSVRGTSRMHALADGLYTIALLALPWCLMWQQLHSIEAWVLPWIVSTSILGLRITMAQLQTSSSTSEAHESIPSIACLSRMSIGVALSVAFFVAWSITQDVSLKTLKQGLLGQHSSLLSYYFHPAIRSPWGWLAVCLFAAGFLSLLVANMSRWSRGWNRRLPTRVQWGCFFCVVSPTLISMDVMEGVLPLVHGLQPRGCSEAILALSPAIVVGWLVLRLAPATTATNRPTVCSSASSDRIVIATIAAIAAFQPLIAYPVPGTQLSLGTLPLVLLLLDGFRIAWVENHFAPFYSWLKQSKDVVFPRFNPAASLAVGAMIVCVPVMITGHRYLSRNSLALPGADLLRLGDQQSQRISAWVKTVQESHVDSLAFRWHNRPSWYLWTQLSPPHCQLPPSWTYLLSEDLQRQQLDQFGRLDRVLVIDEAYAPPATAPSSPLQNAWSKAGIEHHGDDDFTFSIWHPKETTE